MYSKIYLKFFYLNFCGKTPHNKCILYVKHINNINFPYHSLRGDPQETKPHFCARSAF